MKDEMFNRELHEYYEMREQKRREDEKNIAVDSLLGIALVIVISVFCAFSLGLVYQTAGQWVADVLTTVWGWVK